MDAFESVVAQILEVGGYWTRIGVKVDLTKEEKRRLGNASMPRPEIDIVAFNPSKNELLLVECKSWLDSGGVELKSFTNPGSMFYSRFKIFNDEPLRAMVMNRLLETYEQFGLICAQRPSVRLVLAAGQIHRRDEAALTAHFENRGWRLITPSEVAESIRAFAKAGYENSVLAIVTKILERNAKPQR